MLRMPWSPWISQTLVAEKREKRGREIQRWRERAWLFRCATVGNMTLGPFYIQKSAGRCWDRVRVALKPFSSLSLSLLLLRLNNTPLSRGYPSVGPLFLHFPHKRYGWAGISSQHKPIIVAVVLNFEQCIFFFRFECYYYYCLRTTLETEVVFLAHKYMPLWSWKGMKSNSRVLSFGILPERGCVLVFVFWYTNWTMIYLLSNNTLGRQVNKSTRKRAGSKPYDTAVWKRFETSLAIRLIGRTLYKYSVMTI